jgi:hypothetical protein
MIDYHEFAFGMIIGIGLTLCVFYVILSGVI